MMMHRVAAPAMFALGLGLTGACAAPYLQPGMRTMIQQGGVEGTVLGDIFRPRVVYETVYVPVVVAPHRSRSTSRRHRPYAHRFMQHHSAR